MRRPLSTAALGGALLLAGAGFDVPSFYVPGFALVLLAVAMTAWVEVAALGAAAVRAPGPARLVEGDPYPLRVEVRGRLLPLPGGEVADPLLEAPEPFGNRRSLLLTADPPVRGRGRRLLAAPALVLRDPLGIRERRVTGAGGDEVLVLPAIWPVEESGRGGEGTGLLGGGGQGSAGAGRDAMAIDFEIDGIRPYREGTPASRVHWPAVARSGEMIERRLVAGTLTLPLVVLDASRPLDAEALEKAVRAAGSLCMHLARQGGCAILMPGDARPIEVDAALSRWPTVHARLALVESGAGLRGTWRGLRAGSVYWVSARPGVDALRDLERMRAAERCLVTPDPRPGLTTAFTVAGCSGQRAGARLRRKAAPGVAA